MAGPLSDENRTPRLSKSPVAGTSALVASTSSKLIRVGVETIVGWMASASPEIRMVCPDGKACPVGVRILSEGPEVPAISEEALVGGAGSSDSLAIMLAALDELRPTLCEVVAERS